MSVKSGGVNTGAPDTDVANYISDLHDAPSLANVFSGMIRPSEEGDKTTLLFACMGDCSHWIEISGDAIDRIEDLPPVVCHGHYHRAAKITMKAPATAPEIAFAGLANLHRAMVLKTQQTSARMASPGAAPCVWAQDENGQWHCV